jgi:N-acyl-D-aspartate/D-glutamate deacylase
MDALRKMSLMPAEMLERSTPAARQKGRLQEGADADIVVFDAGTISDHATFEKPMEPSVGVHYLLVAGTVIVDEGKIVPDVFPGRALLGRAGLHASNTGRGRLDKTSPGNTRFRIHANDQQPRDRTEC